MKTAIEKVTRVGRVTVFAVGLAVVLALTVGLATTALAAVPGDPFKLGKNNTVNQISQLVGTTASSMLRIDNNGGGTALQLLVERARHLWRSTRRPALQPTSPPMNSTARTGAPSSPARPT
jgi:hypothetical protein